MKDAALGPVDAEYILIFLQQYIVLAKKPLPNAMETYSKCMKESLEKKLKTSHGVKVTPTSPDKVTIIFNGEEKEFFAKLAEVKIRAQSSDVADSSGSDGGIRARPPGIILADGEVRGFILKVAKEHYVFRIIETNSKEFKIGDTIDMKFEKDLPIKKNLNLYFVPEKKEDGFWSPKEGTLTR